MLPLCVVTSLAPVAAEVLGVPSMYFHITLNWYWWLGHLLVTLSNLCRKYLLSWNFWKWGRETTHKFVLHSSEIMVAMTNHVLFMAVWCLECFFPCSKVLIFCASTKTLPVTCTVFIWPLTGATCWLKFAFFSRLFQNLTGWTVRHTFPDYIH
jgi:hypothetical protein